MISLLLEMIAIVGRDFRKSIKSNAILHTYFIHSDNVFFLKKTIVFERNIVLFLLEILAIVGRDFWECIRSNASLHTYFAHADMSRSR
jgi:hypothetical protein